jgi:2-hydroxyacyl-CoA lyase 1
MAEISASTVLARALRQQRIEHVFGVIGIPVNDVAPALQAEGIQFYGMHHEQGAAYAAQCLGYLTRRPGVCLTVSGPGSTNAVSALANAQANCWPLLVLSGGSDLSRRGMGDFEEMPQLEATLPYTKYSMIAQSAGRLPVYVEQATRAALYGRPGPVYVELPGDVITARVDEAEVQPATTVADPPRLQANADQIERALSALRSASRPLVIFGKGAAYSRAEDELRSLIELTGLPWLSSPMGKGLVPDDHPLSTAACRTFAIQNADLVLMIGARFNWLFHFGRPPRFAADLRVIQIDIEPEEIGHNVPAEIGIVGDARAVLGQLNAALRTQPWQFDGRDWLDQLDLERRKNVEKAEPLLESNDLPMSYYRMLRVIRDLLPADTFVTTEGAATMDISRQVLNTYEPRHRIDAGTLGTMGVGTGQAIATQIANPGSRVLALEGDSAFGFDAMEIEVAVRYRLPIVFVVANNNGIGGGPEELNYDQPLPPGCFVPNIRYEKIMEAFGGLGFYAETPEDFHRALEDAFASRQPCLVNVKINPGARRREQQFAWSTHAGATAHG